MCLKLASSLAIVGAFKPVLWIRSIFFRIRIRGSGYENTDPDPT